jgi:hypothetical protein
MSWLKRLLGTPESPKQRIRVCSECGMPVAEHKEWCSILRGQADRNRRADRPSSPLAAPEPSDS